MFPSLIAVDPDLPSESKSSFLSWNDGKFSGHTWPDYFWADHHEENYFDDPMMEVPGYPETFIYDPFEG